MLPELEAERQLLAIEAAAVPHMEDSSRSRTLNRLTRAGERRKHRSAAEALATLPIPVRHFPKEVKQHGR